MYFVHQILQVDQVPDLQGGNIKDRPVLVLEPPRNAGVTEGHLIAVGITGRVDNPDGIRLPDESEYPDTTTGLVKPSVAVPEWLLTIPTCLVLRSRGHTKSRHTDTVKDRVPAIAPTQIRCGNPACPLCLIESEPSAAASHTARPAPAEPHRQL